MQALVLNEQLRNLYLEQLPLIYDTIRMNARPEQLKDIHGPFMMHVYPEYTESKKKIMFVGMETHGWEDCKLDEDFLDTHRRLTSRYESFMTNQEQPNSPFWWFIKRLNLSYGQEEFNRTVLWTNLSKIDIEKKRPVGNLYNHSMGTFLNILEREVAIVNPDILVIMTTSLHYSYHLKNFFGVHDGSSTWETILPKLLYRWTSEKLPFNTFQICHPNSLRFKKGGFQSNANLIIEAINELVK